MRPPGYEPGELPTAPLRDINQNKSKNTSNRALSNCCISELRCKGTAFI